MDMDSFKAFINDDITWCANKCDEKECFRNSIHMKTPNSPHSFSYFEGTEECTKSNNSKKEMYCTVNNLDVTKFEDSKYYCKHCEEILVYKIDNNIKLNEDELWDFLEFELTQYREYGDKGRWDRSVYSICYLCHRYFELDWSEGLTEYQESEIYTQPYEVKRHEYQKTITVTEWEAI